MSVPADPENFDLVIIGRGAAAFSAAIKASELSGGEMTIAMVGYGPLGGTCVNVGCVPSKYLLEASHRVHNPLHPRMRGIYGTEVRHSFSEVMEGLRQYVKNARETKYSKVIENYDNVTVFEGRARFTGKRTVEVVDIDGNSIGALKGANVLIATGSHPSEPPVEGLRDAGFLTSDTIWSINELPSSVAIIGAGSIGLEIGQALLHFGSRVTVVDVLDTLLPQSEPEIRSSMRQLLESEGMLIHLSSRVTRAGRSGKHKFLDISTPDGLKRIDVDEIIVATGREPNTRYLNLEAAGVETDGHGGIITDLSMRTSARGVYAAGDCISKDLFLETLAAREGVVAVANMFGEGISIDYNSTPWAVFTQPQIAGVGATEEKYSRENGSCESRTLPLENLTLAGITGETEGLVKIVTDSLDGNIVGMHIMAPDATNLIMEGVYAIRNGLNVDDIISTSHIFPSFSEGVKLSAQSFIRDISRMSCCME